MLLYLLLLVFPFADKMYNACELSNITYQTSSCNDEGKYTVFFDLDHANTGDSFNIISENNILGTFAYSDLPVSVGNMPGNGQNRTFHFQDIDHPNCTASKTIEAPDCGLPGACTLSGLQLYQLDCNDNNQFKVKISFNYEDAGQSFKLYINGAYQGTYDYADLPVTTGWLDGLVNDDYHFLIQDAEHNACSVSGNISGPYCGNAGSCLISEISGQFSDCDDNGNYQITVDFNSEDTGSEFKLFFDNNYVGNYAYSELPVTVPDIPGDGIGHFIKIQDITNPDCYAYYQFMGQDCGNSNSCFISNVTHQASDCNDEGLFDLVLDFDHINTGTSFKLFKNDDLAGVYEYDQLPLTLTGLEGNGNPVVFAIKDTEHPNCFVYYTVLAPQCGQPDECDISNITYEATDCDDEGYYGIYIDFDHVNTGSEFKLFFDNDYLGVYSYDDLPVLIPGIAGNGWGHVVKVQDTGHPDCFEYLQFGGQDCGGGPCILGNLSLIPLECDDDNQFKVKINLSHYHTSAHFEVSVNGETYGPFSYADLPVIVGPFDGNTDGIYEFIITDLEHPDCNVTGFLSGPHCQNNAECDIYDITYQLSDCDSSGNYSVWLDFQHENTGSAFHLYFDNLLVGTYNYDQLPLEIPNIEGNGWGHVIKVIDADHSGCFEYLQFGGKDCNAGGCSMSNLDVLQLECDENGQFNVKIKFQHHNTSSHFTIHGNGNDYGTFSYDDLPVVLGPFDGSVNNIYEFVVKDLQNPDCNIAGFITGPYCNDDDCHLSHMAYNHGACDSSGHYSIYLSCSYVNASDSFRLYFDGNLVGKFAYADMPVEVSGILGDGSHHAYKMIDSGNDNCRVAAEFPGPDCIAGDECNIGNVTALPSNCDNSGQFYVELDFDHVHVSDSFKVYGNGNNYGTFSYGDLPVVLGPFDGNVNNIYEFAVKDQLDGGCHNSTFITPPYCQNGFPNPVTQLTISNFGCIDENRYYADVSINLEGVDNIPVKIFEENKLIGEFMSYSFPRQLTFDNQNLPRLKAASSDDPGNFAIAAYEHPDCILDASEPGTASIRYYPNPVTSVLNIDWPEQSYTYRISNVAGQVVASGKASGKSAISTEAFPHGIYFIQLNNGKVTGTKHFIRLY